MPDGEPQAALMDSSRRRPAFARPRPSLVQRADQALVAAQVERIMCLIAAGHLHNAREACADLLFDFQPLIVARPELCQRFVAALRRCDAQQLLRRLATAADCDIA
jgi:hypothetical protein